MDDYEIRDVMNRLQHPHIELEFSVTSKFKNGSNILESFDLDVSLANTGTVYANYVVAYIDVPRDIASDRSFEHGFDPNRVDNPNEFRTYTRDNTVRDVVDVGGSGSYTYPKYGPARYDPLLPSLVMRVDEIVLLSRIIRKFSESDYVIRWAIYADNAPPSSGEIALADITFADIVDEEITFGEYASGIEIVE